MKSKPTDLFMRGPTSNPTSIALGSIGTVRIDAFSTRANDAAGPDPRQFVHLDNLPEMAEVLENRARLLLREAQIEATALNQRAMRLREMAALKAKPVTSIITGSSLAQKEPRP